MRVCIEFDECKPHWAKQRGLDKEAERIGLGNITITGDFDAKITRIYGDIDSFEPFKKRFELSPLCEGSLHKVR